MKVTSHKSQVVIPIKNKTLQKLMLLPLLSAALLCLAFSRLNLGVIAWFGLVPFLLSINNVSLKKRLLLSFIFGFVFFMGALYWLINVSLIGLTLLCLYLSCYILLFGAVTKKSDSRYCLFTIPLAWIAAEYARSYLLTGFGWALLGHSQFKNIYLIQISNVLGVWGISFIIVMVNVLISQLIIKKFRICLHDPALWIVLLFVFVVYGYGAICLQQPIPALDLKISIIQPNIPQEQKWDPVYTKSILNRFAELTTEAAKDHPDLIVWPETSVPGYLLDEPKLYKNITTLAQEIKTNLLVGSPREDLARHKYYNSAFLFSPEGELLKYHDKIHLVPFGEYIPCEKILGFLYDAGIGDFSPGEKYTVFEVPNKKGQLVRFAVLVCFEDMFPSLVKKFHRQKADILITITNEAWFGISSEPIQHLAASVFRAVENHSWFIRSANTGISCFIDPQGKIRAKVEQDNEDIFIPGFKTLSL
ncbi:MAG: apolipoprotein N-acyltransferase [Candidatus Omnitrophota bacterium]